MLFVLYQGRVSASVSRAAGMTMMVTHSFEVSTVRVLKLLVFGSCDNSMHEKDWRYRMLETLLET